MTTTPVLHIGTRASPLALAQTRELRRRLAEAWPSLTEDALAEVAMKTTGDVIEDRVLADVGGKGLFTKELDEALLNGTLELAVHSVKDLPTQLPDGLILAAVLPREDVRDAFISPKATSLDELPPGSVVGTASLRRAAQILNRRPDLKVVPFRGNVQTRLNKLSRGEVDATILALAGLKRLGIEHIVTQVLEPSIMLPAVGQGAIGITCRDEDDNVRRLLAAVNCADTMHRVSAERAFLGVLDGSCRTPIAGLAQVMPEGRLTFKGMVIAPDGSSCEVVERAGSVNDATAIGLDAGRDLLSRAGPALAACRSA